MHNLSNVDAIGVEVNYKTLASKYFNSDDPVAVKAANANDQIGLRLFSRLVAFFDAWSQSSYNVWKKAGKPELH